MHSEAILKITNFFALNAWCENTKTNFDIFILIFNFQTFLSTSIQKPALICENLMQNHTHLLKNCLQININSLLIKMVNKESHPVYTKDLKNISKNFILA